MLLGEFYQLYPGNWSVSLADLGNLPSGEKTEDTYYALSEINKHLRQMGIIPIMEEVRFNGSIIPFI